MKYLLLSLSIVFLSLPAFGVTSAQLWKQLSASDKEKLLDAHLEFYEEYSITSQEELAKLSPSHLWELISSAYASNMDCIYAGWPSKRVSGLCSTPVRHNPGYVAGQCKSSELQCQPMLFGSGFCVPASTQKQRNLAFSNCTQKFASSGRTIKEVVSEIDQSGKQAELFEVMGFAEKICKVGKQASTPMCKRLLQVVGDLKAKAQALKKDPIKEEKGEAPPLPPKEEKQDLPPTPPTPPEGKIESEPPVKKPEIIIEGKKETDPKIEEDFIKTVEQANQLNSQAKSSGMIMCETNVPYARTEPRDNLDGIGLRHVDGNYERIVVLDKATRRVDHDSGVRVQMTGPNELAPDQTRRIWDFISVDHALNATYLEITEDPNPDFTSHSMRSVYVLIPRKEIPRAETKGDEIHVTLPTGEMVIFDAKTKMVKKRAIAEKAIDTSPNRFKRKFNTDYVGEGISIRVDRRGDDPRTGSGNVVITQKGKTCTLPKSSVWGGDVHNPKFKFNDDNRLVQELNSRCNVKFNL